MKNRLTISEIYGLYQKGQMPVIKIVDFDYTDWTSDMLSEYGIDNDVIIKIINVSKNGIDDNIYNVKFCFMAKHYNYNVLKMNQTYYDRNHKPCLNFYQFHNFNPLDNIGREVSIEGDYKLGILLSEKDENQLLEAFTEKVQYEDKFLLYFSEKYPVIYDVVKSEYKTKENEN